MNKSLIKKLDQLLERHEELAAILSENATISDQKKFRAYSKEYSELELIVSCFKKIGVNSKEILETEKMLGDPDIEIQELAGNEITDLKKEGESLRQEESSAGQERGGRA